MLSKLSVAVEIFWIFHLEMKISTREDGETEREREKKENLTQLMT